MLESNMSFTVNADAVVYSMLDGEIKARIFSRKNPAKRRLYEEKGIMNSSSSITRFMAKHSNFFGNPKLIHSDGSNFFGSKVSLSYLSGTSDYNERLKSRMQVEYDLAEEELKGVDSFLRDLILLKASPDICTIVEDTKDYKDSIENVWRANEERIMNHIYETLGYVPQNPGTVNTYIMYPNFDIHRSCQQTSNSTSFWLGYKYRNVEKEGLDSAQEISKAIRRDQKYFEGVPVDSKRRKMYSKYGFEKLDSQKIAKLFREKKAITPYEFLEFDFRNKSLVYKTKYLVRDEDFSK